jgi:hypothetical protein
LQIKTKIDSSHTADSKPVKQGVNSTVILPPLVFPDIQLENEAVWQHRDTVYCGPYVFQSKRQYFKTFFLRRWHFQLQGKTLSIAGLKNLA